MIAKGNLEPWGIGGYQKARYGNTAKLGPETPGLGSLKTILV